MPRRAQKLMQLWTVVLIVRIRAADAGPLEELIAENLVHLDPMVVVALDRYEIRLTVRTRTLREAQRYATERVARVLAHIGLVDASVEIRDDGNGHG
jgi:hypothetical protein